VKPSIVFCHLNTDLNSPLPRYSVIVPAAGIGKRMQADCPKQYLKIAGKTILEHTLSNLLAHNQVKQVFVVLHPEDRLFAQLQIATHPAITLVVGGKERCDSVLAGLNLVPEHEHWVLVHDAARPCLHPDDLTSLLEVAHNSHCGAILAAPVRDTMKRSFLKNTSKQTLVKQTEPRENLWHALTPQIFELALLKKALEQAAQKSVCITDEASAMELLGEEVLLVEGRASNIKVTQPADLLLAEFYLTQQQPIKGEDKK
jgi:2-C-methyl-D-erythritol 4-phosphate cytidylyltransferase